MGTSSVIFRLDLTDPEPRITLCSGHVAYRQARLVVDSRADRDGLGRRRLSGKQGQPERLEDVCAKGSRSFRCWRSFVAG